MVPKRHRLFAPIAFAFALALAPGIAGCSAPGSGYSTNLVELRGMPLVFHETFESGLESWEFTDPDAWKIQAEEGGRVLALVGKSNYSPPVRSPHSIAMIRDLSVTDFIMEARLEQTGREYGHRDMCVFFGINDAAHFYYAHIATKADAHANSIFIVNGEPRLSIAAQRTGGTDWGTGDHLVRIERFTASGLIRVFFDDMQTPIMTASDRTFPAGRVGFGSFDDTGTIGQVRIWARVAE